MYIYIYIYIYIHRELQEIKYILKEEGKAANKSEKISILRSILYQPFMYFYVF